MDQQKVQQQNQEETVDYKLLFDIVEPVDATQWDHLQVANDGCAKPLPYYQMESGYLV